MALTDNNDPRRHSAPSQKLRGQTRLPQAALDRLPLLYAENKNNTGLADFLAGAVNAAGLLTLLGAAALAFEAGTTLKSCFGWALLVLIGVGALLRSYIRSTAAAFDQAPLTEAAQDLRAILLYVGFAWGAGAFLVLPPVAAPAAILGFAGLPSLGMMLLLKDQGGSLAFVLPVTILSLAAAVLQSWPDAGLAVASLLMLQGSIAARIILGSRRPRSSLPAGLALR